LDWLLIARLLQGLGAASGFVIARAIARDAFQGAALIRIFGLLTLTMGIVPALAPALGGVIQDSVGWQANMGVTVIMGIIMTVLCFIFLPETGTKSEGSFSPPQIALTYISIIKDRTFRRFAGTNALVLGSLYAFHAGAPELMISQLGLNPSTFGLLAFLHSVAFMLGAYTAPMIGERIPEPSHVMGGGAVTALIASVAMLALGLTGHATVVSIMIFMTIFGYALGVVIPFGVAGALSPFKARAGTATALLGAMQMSAGALASATVAAFPDVPALAFPAVMVAMNALAIMNARRSRHEIVYKEEP
jgi:DHA1 family bicyclomycin/chloramphenicol resistance-like MFS transporter